MADAPRTPVDDIPIEVRRLNWGWFGDPWPSGVCYDDDDGRLLEEMRKPFPAGETCLWCGEPLDEAAGDSGQALPSPRGEVRHVHKECLLRSVTGPWTAWRGHHEHRGDQTYRQEALEVWEWVQRHGGTHG